jgi:hypothetical protein
LASTNFVFSIILIGLKPAITANWNPDVLMQLHKHTHFKMYRNIHSHRNTYVDKNVNTEKNLCSTINTHSVPLSYLVNGFPLVPWKIISSISSSIVYMFMRPFCEIASKNKQNPPKMYNWSEERIHLKNTATVLNHFLHGREIYSSNLLGNRLHGIYLPLGLRGGECALEE